MVGGWAVLSPWEGLLHVTDRTAGTRGCAYYPVLWRCARCGRTLAQAVTDIRELFYQHVMKRR